MNWSKELGPGPGAGTTDARSRAAPRASPVGRALKVGPSAIPGGKAISCVGNPRRENHAFPRIGPEPHRGPYPSTGGVGPQPGCFGTSRRGWQGDSQVWPHTSTNHGSWLRAGPSCGERMGQGMPWNGASHARPWNGANVVTTAQAIPGGNACCSWAHAALPWLRRRRDPPVPPGLRAHLNLCAPGSSGGGGGGGNGSTSDGDGGGCTPGSSCCSWTAPAAAGLAMTSRLRTWR